MWSGDGIQPWAQHRGEGIPSPPASPIIVWQPDQAPAGPSRPQQAPAGPSRPQQAPAGPGRNCGLSGLCQPVKAHTAPARSTSKNPCPAADDIRGSPAFGQPCGVWPSGNQHRRGAGAGRRWPAQGVNAAAGPATWTWPARSAPGRSPDRTETPARRRPPAWRRPTA